MDMHRSGRTGDHDGRYIWLRYSTQFTRGGQPHTIEMEIPVPVGASAEEREQLIREAEAGLEQMYRQIERRGGGRGQQPPEGSRPQVTPVQTGAQPAPPATPTRTPAPSAQVAVQANARDMPQAGSPPTRRETTETAAPARSSIGSEMPVTPNLSASASGNIRLPEFIQIIRKNWGLTPKDVIDLLQVPNLNNMNYRELLRQLEELMAQREKAASVAKNTGNATSAARTTSTPAPASAASRPPAPSPPVAPASTMRDASVKPAPPSPSSRSAPSAAVTHGASPASPPPVVSKPATPAAPPSPGLDGPANIPVYPLPGNTLREVPRSYKFDEEEEEDEAEEAQGGSGEDENGMSEALARIKIDELRDNRGNAVTSPARLTVLHNLLDSQISDEQFQQLIEGLWNVNSDKKLKQDQAEALISWAKEDYFEDEVRAVIAVLKG